jgi:hypothetical protein
MTRKAIDHIAVALQIAERKAAGLATRADRAEATARDLRQRHTDSTWELDALRTLVANRNAPARNGPAPSIPTLTQAIEDNPLVVANLRRLG